jgi:transposase
MVAHPESGLRNLVGSGELIAHHIEAFRQAVIVVAIEKGVGLVPKQHSSGDKDRLGSISKRGDRHLRSLFTAGALAVIRYAKIHGTTHRPWLTALLARRPTKVAAIALANKIARMAWPMMAKGERYKEPAALAA